MGPMRDIGCAPTAGLAPAEALCRSPIGKCRASVPPRDAMPIQFVGRLPSNPLRAWILVAGEVLPGNLIGTSPQFGTRQRNERTSNKPLFRTFAAGDLGGWSPTPGRFLRENSGARRIS